MGADKAVRQGQQNRRGRGRNNNNNNNNSSSSGSSNNNRKHPNPLSRSFESNGPDVKVRGTPAHIAEKYLTLARDAHSSGDWVLAESYLQHAEHYNRIIMAYREQLQQPGDGNNGNGQRMRPGGSEGLEGGDDFGDDEGDDVGDDLGGGPQPLMPQAQQTERPMERNDRQDRNGNHQFRGDRGFDNQAQDDRGDRQFRRDREQGRFRGDRPRSDQRNDRGNERVGERGPDRNGNRDRPFENGPARADDRDNRDTRDSRDNRDNRGETSDRRPSPPVDRRPERAPPPVVETVTPEPMHVAEVAAPAPPRRRAAEKFQEHDQPGFLKPPRPTRRARPVADTIEPAADTGSDGPKSSDS